MSADTAAIDAKSAVWCLHCERAYDVGEFRRIDGLRLCPYQDCDGDAVLDQWDWARIRHENSQYPASPMRGVFYPLYGRHR